MGAIKAGVTIVSFDEKDSLDALNSTLKDSQAKGFMLSPSTVISQDGHNTLTRQTYLHKLMPELHSLYPGDELALQNYPHLKQIVQLSHTTIRGVIKYKDSMVYANPRLSNQQLPENAASDVSYVTYQNGKESSTITSGDMTSYSQSLWSNHLSQTSESPLFLTLNLETPLALASVLAANINFKKVYIPATFSMTQILGKIHTQKSHILICDQELFELEPPQQKEAEFKEMTKSVANIVVGQTSGKKLSGKSHLFSSSQVSTIDAYKLE